VVGGRIADAAAGNLAGYKRPRLYFHAAALPRDPTGKLLRAALRDALARWSPGDGDFTVLELLPSDPPTTAGAGTASAPSDRKQPT
jgi:hypothetical protein